jgi:hypothetical protein
LDSRKKEKRAKNIMPRARKTIELAEVLEISNRMLANTPDSDVDGRNAVISLLCGILHRANAYAGFGYLASSGIDFKAENVPATIKDDTRRMYYTHI